MSTQGFSRGVAWIESLHERQIFYAGEVIFDAGSVANERHGGVSFKCPLTNRQDACQRANQGCFARPIGAGDHAQCRWKQVQINGLKDGFAVTMKADLAGNEIRLHDIAR